MKQGILVKAIPRENRHDIHIPNEPFELSGRLSPSYINGKWDYEAEYFESDRTGSMCFPDENYDYDELKRNSVILGAYMGDICVGMAILQHRWNRYIYLSDLKVRAAYRGRGIASHLIEACRNTSRETGYRGIHTIAQDNNLGACLFYLNRGFVLGGLDTEVYRGTRQEGKINLLFYTDN